MKTADKSVPTITMTRSDGQKEIVSFIKDSWRKSRFANIIFDKSNVSKDKFHDHLIRIYEGLNHIKAIKMFITAEMLSVKSVNLNRTAGAI